MISDKGILEWVVAVERERRLRAGPADVVVEGDLVGAGGGGERGDEGGEVHGWLLAVLGW